MDDRRFDELTRTLAGVSSRRSVLKALSGGALAAAGTLIGVNRAGACRPVTSICRKNGDCCSNNCGPRDITGRQRCACPSGQTLCDGACKGAADFASDVQNCGSCDNVCGADPCFSATCTDGVCGQTPVVCGANATCSGGACACDGGQTALCPNGDCCPVGQVCNSGNICTGTQDLGSSCMTDTVCASNLCCPAGTPREGLCGLPDGAACPNGSNNACCSGTCVEGTCQPARGALGAVCDSGDEADCEENLTCCISDGSPTGFACVDTSSDPNNCGNCAAQGSQYVCGANETCSAGACACSGGPAATCDDGSCCPQGEICGPGDICSAPLGTGLTCAEELDCASGTCCPAGMPREGLCGIPTGQPCPVNSGSPSNNSCCSGSCIFDSNGITATCQDKQPAGGPCDVGDVADCQAGLTCCSTGTGPTGWTCVAGTCP
jgi:hypothetical protein